MLRCLQKGAVVIVVSGDDFVKLENLGDTQL